MFSGKTEQGSLHVISDLRSDLAVIIGRGVIKLAYLETNECDIVELIYFLVELIAKELKTAMRKYGVKTFRILPQLASAYSPVSIND